MPSSTNVVLLEFVPLLLLSAEMAFLAFLLAKEKGRNRERWTALGLIPFANMFCIGDLVGAAHRQHAENPDEPLRLLKRSAAAE